MLKKIWPVLVLIIILLPLIFPLFRPGFFVTDDGDWIVIRLAAFHSTLRTGQFPVRYLYSLNHGFGYPVLNFNYPLPFYFGEAIHLLGFGFVDSVKILFGASFILSALGMYFLVAKKWGRWPGLIAAAFYSYAPYRIFDVYRRGSLGEAVAFIFMPLIFLFLKRNLPLAALSYAALITSHNAIALLFSPVLFIYTVIKVLESDCRPRALLYSFVFYLLSISSSAFFWFPAIFDLRFTRTMSVQVSDFNNYFLGLNNFSGVLGFLIPAVLICAIILILSRKKSDPFFTLVFTLLSLLFTLPVSWPIWQATPLPKLVQFPWRFLSITVFGSAILAGYLFSVIKKPFFYIAALIVIIFISFPLIKTQPANKPDSYYSTNDDSTTIKNEYMPKWVKTDPQNAPAARLEIVAGVSRILDDKTVLAASPSTIQINRVYFPGLKVYLDEKEVSFDYERTGFPQVEVSAGKHTLTANFTETPLRLTANLISLAGIGIALIMLTPLTGRQKRIVTNHN